MVGDQEDVFNSHSKFIILLRQPVHEEALLEEQPLTMIGTCPFGCSQVMHLFYGPTPPLGTLLPISPSTSSSLQPFQDHRRGRGSGRMSLSERHVVAEGAKERRPISLGKRGSIKLLER